MRIERTVGIRSVEKSTATLIGDYINCPAERIGTVFYGHYTLVDLYAAG